MASSAQMSLKLMRASALLDGDPAAALEAAAQILLEDPSNTAAQLLLGTAARRGGMLSLLSKLCARWRRRTRVRL